MKKYLLIAAFLSLNLMNAESQNIADTNIRKFLDLTGVRSQCANMIKILVESYKTQIVFIDGAIWDSLNIVFTKSIDSLYVKSIPIYKKYYSNDEILQLIDFYKTPIGQKSLVVLPDLSKEFAKAGQDWGKSLEPKITEVIDNYYGPDKNRSGKRKAKSRNK